MATKATQSTPCSIPTTDTAPGRPATYFRGIATPSKTKNEMASHHPTTRSQWMGSGPAAGPGAGGDEGDVEGAGGLGIAPSVERPTRASSPLKNVARSEIA